jgi:hypothetical protein
MAGMSKLPAVYRHGFVLGNMIDFVFMSFLFLYLSASSMAVSYWLTVKWLRQRSKELVVYLFLEFSTY